MADINYWLGVKYGLLGQQADADTLRAQAAGRSAGADITRANAQAALVGPQSASIAAQAAKAREEAQQVAPLAQSNIGENQARSELYGSQAVENRARSGLYGSQARRLDAETGWLGPLNKSTIEEQAAKSKLLGTQSDVLGQPLLPNTEEFGTAVGKRFGIPDAPKTTPQSRSLLDPKPFGYSEGMSTIPGEGSGKVDTVPAMLAPGEAVLNKAAAEMLGRGMIASLNKRGSEMMGMQPEKKSPGKYAGGASMIPVPAGVDIENPTKTYRNTRRSHTLPNSPTRIGGMVNSYDYTSPEGQARNYSVAASPWYETYVDPEAQIELAKHIASGEYGLQPGMPTPMTRYVDGRPSGIAGYAATNPELSAQGTIQSYPGMYESREDAQRATSFAAVGPQMAIEDVAQYAPKQVTVPISPVAQPQQQGGIYDLVDRTVGKAILPKDIVPGETNWQAFMRNFTGVKAEPQKYAEGIENVQPAISNWLSKLKDVLSTPSDTTTKAPTQVIKPADPNYYNDLSKDVDKSKPAINEWMTKMKTLQPTPKNYAKGTAKVCK